MAAYRRVYDSRHLQADCQELGSAPESYARYIEYGLPLPFLQYVNCVPKGKVCVGAVLICLSRP